MSAESEPVLTVDLRRQFGRVCVAGTRIPAEVLAETVFAGDSVDSILRDYEITREQVLVACWWRVEQARTQRRKTKADRAVLARWEAWADMALLILGGHQSGPCPDPPEEPE